MNRLMLFWGLCLLVACNPFSGNSDQRATEQAQGTARVETALFAGTQAGTVVALQATADNASIMATQLSQLEREREFLEATYQAIQTFGVTPLPRLTVAPSPAGTSFPALESDYLNLQTATRIDDATGCAVDEQAGFSLTDQIIYFTFIAQNLKAQTALKSRWYRDKELRYESEAWLPDQDYAEICAYFWLEPSYTAFDAGIWSVELRAQDQLIGAVSFQICEEGRAC